MFTSADLLRELERALIGGYDTSRVARAAFEINQQYGLQLTAAVDWVVTVLMTMDAGPEFELDEPKFLDLIEKVRNM
ncbi:MAG TPA: hypothetical protein VD865_04370 [Stenotrophomonas sp.]|nr:hypothetical protein [Stenotrophomonas sp.]